MRIGRPKDSLKHRFERIIEDARADMRFKQILIKTKDDGRFLQAYELAYDRAFGKAPQSIDMRTEDVTPRPSIADLDAALESLNHSQNGKGMASSK